MRTHSLKKHRPSQENQARSHRSGAVHPAFLHRRLISKVANLTSFHTAVQAPLSGVYPQSQQRQGPSTPAHRTLRVPGGGAELLITPVPCARASGAHLTHVGPTPRLGPTEQRRRQGSEVAASLVLAFLLKRAAGWHHASRQPMRCAYLSGRQQTSESTKSHLVERGGTAQQRRFHGRSPEPPAREDSTPCRETLARPLSWPLWSQE